MLVGSKEEAKVVVGEFGNFLAGDGEEADDIMKLSPFALLGPDPGVTISYAEDVIRKQSHSLRPRSRSGVPVPDVVRGIDHAWLVEPPVKRSMAPKLSLSGWHEPLGAFRPG